MLDYLKKLYDYIPSLQADELPLDELSSAVKECIEDATLSNVVEKYYNDIFESGKEYTRTEIAEMSDSYAEEKIGTGMLFAVVLALRAFILTDDKAFIYNGEALNFFNPYLRHLKVNLKCTNSIALGDPQRFLSYCYLCQIAFELGRLAFEILNFNYGYEVWADPETGDSYPIALAGLRFDENGLPDNEGSFETTYEYDGETLVGYTYTDDGRLDFEKKTFRGLICSLKKGDKALAIHMPGNKKLDEDAVTASFEGARVFFDRYFPNLDYKAFVSSSWLLDTNLRAFLKEDSNIVKLQKRFRIALAFKNDFSLFDNVFNVLKCPIEELVPTNRFQKEILEMIKAGGTLYSGRGYILRDDSYGKA